MGGEGFGESLTRLLLLGGTDAFGGLFLGGESVFKFDFCASISLLRKDEFLTYWSFLTEGVVGAIPGGVPGGVPGCVPGGVPGGSRGWRGEALRHARGSGHWSESSESDSLSESVSLCSTATRRAKIDATSNNGGAPLSVLYLPVFSSQRFSTLRNLIPEDEMLEVRALIKLLLIKKK